MAVVTVVVCRQNMSVVLQIGIVYVVDIKKGYCWILYPFDYLMPSKNWLDGWRGGAGAK